MSAVGDPFRFTVRDAGPFAPRSEVIIQGYYSNALKQKVLLLSEPDDNPGMSITNMAEKLHTEMEKEFPHFSTNAGVIWIEHYPPYIKGFQTRAATFDQVTFENGRASWKRLETEDVLSLLGEIPPFINEEKR